MTRIEKVGLFVREKRYWLVLGVLGALIYYAWTGLSRPQGTQEVTFKPARKSCNISGRLRYCIYTAHAGSNGDILYHLHGRNLDEQIWNDGTYFTALVQDEWQ